MIRRTTLLILAFSALVALQFADCLSPMSADNETMQCCGSMPCNPADQSPDCCKTMASADGSNVLPAQHLTLTVPVTIVVNHFATPEVPIFTPVFDLKRPAPSPSPPTID